MSDKTRRVTDGIKPSYNLDLADLDPAERVALMDYVPGMARGFPAAGLSSIEEQLALAELHDALTFSDDEWDTIKERQRERTEATKAEAEAGYQASLERAPAGSAPPRPPQVPEDRRVLRDDVPPKDVSLSEDAGRLIAKSYALFEAQQRLPASAGNAYAARRIAPAVLAHRAEAERSGPQNAEADHE